MWWFTLCFTVACHFCYCSSEEGPRHLYGPGDIIIGGLFPVHSQVNRTNMTGPAFCSDYDLQMFLATQMMVFAIQELNQQTPKMFPNLTIGYDIYDTCGDVTFALRASLQLLKDRQNSCNLSSDPHAKVVIGERTSEVSIAVARIFALQSVTQISYGSSSELLSRKNKFPTFLRTISSDAHQTTAIAKLVETFNWQTVGVVGSDDEYGKYGTERLIDLFNIKKICIDFKVILPGDFSSTSDELKKLMEDIENSVAEAIILFTKEGNVELILDKAIQRRLNRTWVASDTWSNSPQISERIDIQNLGQVYGFIPKYNPVAGFEDYVTSEVNKSLDILRQQQWIPYPRCPTHSMMDEKKCSLKNIQCLEPECLLGFIDLDESYNIYVAVKVIAEGLKSLLNCDSKTCERNATFTPAELLSEIKQVNFTDNMTQIFFDKNGDPNMGYKIVYWNMSEHVHNLKQRIEPIGEFVPPNEIKLPKDLIINMQKLTKTAYGCFKSCAPGEKLILKSKKQCCKICNPCENGFVSQGNSHECQQCATNQYTSLEKDTCLNKSSEYLQPSNPFVIVLNTLTIVGIAATIVVAILFTVHRRTPIVKAVGGYLSFLELFSLLICFCLIFNFTGEPTRESCMVGLPLFGMAFTLCIACILANLFQILVGFNFNQMQGGYLKRLNKPVAVVITFFGVQVTLCVLWLTLGTPLLKEDTTPPETILLHCTKGTKEWFIAMLCYNALLAMGCFLFAFKGKRLPDLYKNASWITISMLLFLTVWIIFIPIYINVVGRYSQAIEAASILVSSYSILSCHLVPKCYIIVFRKEINNEKAIADYIKKHYEQKGIAVVS